MLVDNTCLLIPVRTFSSCLWCSSSLLTFTALRGQLLVPQACDERVPTVQ